MWLWNSYWGCSRALQISLDWMGQGCLSPSIILAAGIRAPNFLCPRLETLPGSSGFRHAQRHSLRWGFVGHGLFWRCFHFCIESCDCLCLSGWLDTHSQILRGNWRFSGYWCLCWAAGWDMAFRRRVLGGYSAGGSHFRRCCFLILPAPFFAPKSLRFYFQRICWIASAWCCQKTVSAWY